MYYAYYHDYQETSRQLEVSLKFIALRGSLEMEMEMKSGSCPWIPAAIQHLQITGD